MQEDKIIDYFSVLKKENKLEGTFIFIGGFNSLVKDIIKTISCQNNFSFCNKCWDCLKLDKEEHPDMLVIERKNKIHIGIQEIKEAIKFLTLKSFKLKIKIILLKEGLLSHEAENAFLKTLEEPPKNSFIALCIEKLDNLLPTVVSRAKKIFLPYKEKERDFSSVKSFLVSKQIDFRDRREFSEFLLSFIYFLHREINFRYQNKNSKELLLEKLSLKELFNLIEKIFEIYKVYSKVNINLAIEIIKSNLSLRNEKFCN